MVILHIGYLKDNKTNGVMVVIPQHLNAQSKFNDVALLNINDYNPENKNNVFDIFFYSKYKKWDINDMPEPFNKPDIVVMHEIYRIPYIKIYKNLKKNNIPYVILAHGSLNKIAQRFKPLKKKISNFLFFNSYIKNSTAIQFLSNKEMENSIFNNKDNNFVIGNGITIRKEEKKEYSIDALKIITISRYDIVSKSFDLIIEACNKIKEYMRVNNITIEIYGKDNYNGKKEIEKMVKDYSIDDIVKLNGEIYNEEKVKKMREADLYIQPSRFEGLSIGLMEAMEMKLPVIVTPVAQIGDVNDNMGIVCECNADSIASAIIKANESKGQFEKWGNNAFNYIKENYDWNIIAEKTVNQYKKIVSQYNKE